MSRAFARKTMYRPRQFPQLTTMQSNVTDYKQVNSLPSFRLFTWFLVAPGALLVLLAAFGLFGGRTLAKPMSVHHTHPTQA